MRRPQSILQSFFGYAAFRGRQEEIIDHVVAGGDAVVLMPTGGGKSMCFQIPAMVRPGVGVVVSPLIALMQDQVAGLVEAGVAAARWDSTLSAPQVREVRDRLVSGGLDLLYVAPERLVSPEFLDLLSRVEVSLFAIDEAHCVSQWGHDFRPEYLQLAVLGELFPGVPRLALTATADEATRKDIVERLGFESAAVFATGFDRPNIRYLVETKAHGRDQLLRFIRTRHQGESGIVYRMSRRKVEETAEFLSHEGVPALPYHAGLDGRTRAANQDRFMREEGLVMVATVAFGMGVDKPDVRFVAHLDPPKSLEAYHQETGRAGRDGLPAEAWMTYGLGDIVALRRLIAGNEAAQAGTPEPEHRRVELRKLDALLGFCETTECRRQVLLGYFGTPLAEPCGNCDTCLDPPETWDGTVAAQKALSCVFRVAQASPPGVHFGVRHHVAVLLGEATGAVSRFDHTAVSTFGIGTELTGKEWTAVYRQLTAGGWLAVDMAGFGGIMLSEASWDILKGKRQVRFRRDAARTKGERRTRGRRSSAMDEFLKTERDRALWDRLRALRSRLAKERGEPPYVIFHDKTLLEMALARPGSADELARVGGVGEAKLARYGQAFLDEIRACLAELGPEPGRGAEPEDGPRPAPRTAAKPPRPGKREAGETVHETLALFRELGSVEAVVERRGLKPSTIWNHLIKSVRGGRIAAREVVALGDADHARIIGQLAGPVARGERSLAEAFEALGGVFPYEALRCVLAELERAELERIGQAAAGSGGVGG